MKQKVMFLVADALFSVIVIQFVTVCDRFGNAVRRFECILI